MEVTECRLLPRLHMRPLPMNIASVGAEATGVEAAGRVDKQNEQH